MSEQFANDELILHVPDFSLVVLIGVSGSGKSTFARQQFLPTEVFSSDAFRGWVSDDENSLEATADAFDALHYLAAIRLRRRRLTVIDATNVQPAARQSLLKLAHDHDAVAVAIVLDIPEKVCQARNRVRPDRQLGSHVVVNQMRSLRRSLRGLKREGFRHVFTLEGEEQAAAARIERIPLRSDFRNETGPFDIIGDVHGCYGELTELLGNLGYAPDEGGAWRHSEGRRAIFLGDIVDRGPGVVETVRLVQAMRTAGTAIVVPGNHDMKLARWMRGKVKEIRHGLEQSIEQIERLPETEQEEFKREYDAFVGELPSHCVLEHGDLVVAHAGMKEAFQGRASRRVRDFALYGETTGEIDEFGLPVRYPWARDYRGHSMVVYGHTPIPEPEWLNRTINIDTGCVFGGRLTALRYPERELVNVPARETYAVSARPFLAAPEAGAAGEPSLQWQADALLDIADVTGKRTLTTSLFNTVTVQAENSAAALEIMSRFGVDPRWLIYLPPTMSPSETATEDGYLEYPAEAFDYFRSQGVPSVICQTKHMGSRAVVVVCRDEAAALRRFGAKDGIGECFSRTGRRFFDGPMGAAFLREAADAVGRAGLWEDLETDWICLDAEILPWNLKAGSLLRSQYAETGAAARLSLPQARQAVHAAVERGLPLGELEQTLATRERNAELFTAAYGNYCWPVNGLEDVRCAPFFLLAAEGKTFFDRDHLWHVETLGRLAECSPLFRATESRVVDLADEASQAGAIAWWLAHTSAGGEGMVVKPLEVVQKGRAGLVQPGVKVRGREYLRIIYGPDYTEPANLERLRKRSLRAKRSLALREFALGVEGLQRFVRSEALRRVHECAFAVLALESEPVDPRL